MAAAAFHSRATATLKARGLPPSYSAVASIVGARPQHYHASVKGTRSVSLDVVARWLQRWAERGWPPLQLVVTAGETLVVTIPDPQTHQEPHAS